MPLTLDYLHPRTQSGTRLRSTTFWLAHAAASTIGLFGLRRLIVNQTYDNGLLLAFSIVSVFVVTGMLGVAYWAWLRKSPPAIGYSIAAVVGLVSFFPGHGLFWTLFLG
jgi:hypothetical protein